MAAGAVALLALLLSGILALKLRRVRAAQHVVLGGQEQDLVAHAASLQAQFEATAKKYGFASYAEYDDVFNNVSLVMSGIDPQTKAFTEPPEALKRQIAEVQADKTMSKEEKKQALEEMNEALKDARPVEFKENVALVTKYIDKLGAIMQQQP